MHGVGVTYAQGLVKKAQNEYIYHMEAELRADTKKFFKEEFANILLENLTNGHSLSSLTVNPFLITALSRGILGEVTPLNMAKSLLYPRVFGTSISTTLGNKLQKFCIHLGARASGIPGMDIEFEDKVDPRTLSMQLKAGPNTINSKDVQPMVAEMNSAYRLLRTNGSPSIPIFAVGIYYGAHADISANYRRIESSSVGSQLNIPIIVGKDFWHRLTGDENFYTDLISVFVELFEQEDYSKLFDEDLKNLAKEISDKYFVEGKFDLGKI